MFSPLTLEYRLLSSGHHHEASTMFRDTQLVNHSASKETRSMKRKPPPNSVIERCSKRHPRFSTAAVSPSSLLIDILRQYGLLETIVSNLRANDLLALLLTSKALREAILPRPASLENLLGRLSCSGKGVEIRKLCHKKSTYFYSFDCTEYVQCGNTSAQRVVKTKPCINCKVATCDECRTHVVYQSIYEAPSDPNDPAELPNFSGFVLLKPSEQAILSPHHLPSEETKDLPYWEDPSCGKAGPYHDQGFLDVPLQMDDVAPPECIAELLDIDLGQLSLMSISPDSHHYGSPSSVLSSLCTITDGRKISFCDGCFQREASKGSRALMASNNIMPICPFLGQSAAATPMKSCHCTLRNRFLDQWLCLPCYQAEDWKINVYTATRSSIWAGHCKCGLIARHTLCLWCWGEVAENDDGIVELDTGSDGTAP